MHLFGTGVLRLWDWFGIFPPEYSQQSFALSSIWRYLSFCSFAFESYQQSWLQKAQYHY